MPTVTLERLDDTYHFRATNEQGFSTSIDSVGDREGEQVGIGPMQMLLMALGGCSGIDVVLILTKGRQAIDSFKMSIDGERDEGSSGRPYRNINVHYDLTGDLDPDKVLRAIRLSHEKYCSVVKNLEGSTTITHSCSVNGNEYA